MESTLEHAWAPAAPGGTLAPVGFLRLLLQLSKARITFAVTFSVTTGYVLFAHRVDAGLWLPAGGVFLLACGSAALNQVQEWRTDARMERTRGRPIPSGRIRPAGALAIAAGFLALGLALLAQVEQGALTVVLLGIFAVVYYNGVYWALKRLTAFAVVPGALIGAVPPVIGWAAAGGQVADATILEVAGFFFIWQIPHFWLLVRLYAAQYEAAGLPTPVRSLSAGQFQRITFHWIVLTSVFGLVLAVRHGLVLPWNVLALGGSVAVVAAALAYLRGRPNKARARRLFMQLNAYALAMMLLLMAQALSR